jgi:excisionase family DNA binding protein
LPETASVSRSRALRAVVDALLTVKDVAEQLGVCRDTVYRLIARQQLPAMRIGGSMIRVRAADLRAFLAAARGGSGPGRGER